MGCACNGDSHTGVVYGYLACAQLSVHPEVSRWSEDTGRDLLAINASLNYYAERVGTPNRAKCYAVAALAALRMPYWKRVPGDCGQATKISLGAGVSASRAVGFGELGFGAVESISSAVSATGAPLVAGVAVPIIGLAALPFTIWGMFSAHHAAAVAKEQATLCDVSVSYNQFAASIEQALASGKIDMQDASLALSDATGKLTDAMRDIAKTGQRDSNFAGGATFALRALDLWNKEIIYPRIAKQTKTNPLTQMPGHFSAVLAIVAAKAVAVAAQ